MHLAVVRVPRTSSFINSVMVRETRTMAGEEPQSAKHYGGRCC